MKTVTRHVMMMLLALTTGLSGVALAQSQDEERRREAERRVEEAQAELTQALRLLRESESDQARARLEESVARLRLAMQQLDRDRVRGLGPEIVLRSSPFFSTSGRPQMGVYLNTSRNPSRDSIGAELDRVVRDGPAWEAGLRDGDIVTHANGEALAQTSRYGLSSGNKLVRIKNDMEPGDTLHVQYRRGNETLTADIELGGSVGNTFSYEITTGPGDVGIVSPRLGVGSRVEVGVPDVFTYLSARLWDMEMVTLDEDLGEYFGTSDGILIIRAPREESLQLKSGDVILNIDGRSPTSPSHALRIMRSYDRGESMSIEIMRNRNRMTVTATVPERGGDGFYWDDRRPR